jgi:hypothetical protein
METETTPENCKQLRSFEGAVVEIFRHHIKGWTKQHICQGLEGWRIVVHDKKPDDACLYTSWDDRYSGATEPFCVIGLAHAELRILEVQTNDWFNSSLAHEMVHAIDINVTQGHCSWKKRGVSEALRLISGFFDIGVNPRDKCLEGK